MRFELLCQKFCAELNLHALDNIEVLQKPDIRIERRAPEDVLDRVAESSAAPLLFWDAPLQPTAELLEVGLALRAGTVGHSQSRFRDPSRFVVVLSEHVDYWNRLGWSDPYSSPAFTGRQQEYASRLRESDIYTPELVVDGSRSLVGSDWPKAKSAIKESLRDLKVPVSVRAERKEETVQIHVNVEANAIKERAVVYVVLARDRAKSQVSRGENAGRDLVWPGNWNR